MNIRKKGIIACCTGALLVGLMSGCATTETEEAANASVETPDSKIELAAAYSTKLVEDRSVYADDQPGTVVDFYITVSDTNLTAEHPITWKQLNSINSKAENTEDKTMEVILQEGDDNGAKSGSFGYGATHPNAEISLRGNSSIRADQKAYKLKLYDQAGLWRGQTTVNLIKHAYDFTRMRNKLSFDLFRQVPDFTSLRTQFVHLHVKDLTSSIAGYQDYGLYTQIEQPNKKFLKSHGLDPNGHLYKATNFEFLRYPDALKAKDDPEYNDAKFQSIMEVKGNEDNTKLLAMLDDVNNLSLDINDVFDRYFDRDNFLTWMSINILTDDIDTNTQNFYLYSPLNSEKWFFLPWDYDGAWGYNEFEGIDDGGRAKWQRGIANYWGSKLQNRFFKDPANVQQLLAKMEEVKTYFSPEKTTALIDLYKPIVNQYVRRVPDLTTLHYPYAKWNNEVDRMKQLPVVNEQNFLKALENPMPFFLGEPELKDGKWEFRWDASYDLQGDDLTYTFMLAKEPSFARPIVKKENYQWNSISVDKLAKGHYFLKVLSKDSKGNDVTAFDMYQDVDGEEFFGVKDFYVD
ncbi:CotH kinase family protein [Paenibacillus aurantiacus]|uniref:CotH kinase family protein n=1 Tax=Paenibacillus aurantiacus TaxID=1936118 RepID=A0ABV5KL04_9BACL